ncbi:MAG TPA: hypothetical protein VNO34_08935 [Actinomycetota bacterium]|nr:hypothetical protein [Actinomycetota bacterium]
MTRDATRLEEDLARWEAELLSFEELEARHPGEDLRGLVDLWARLQAEGQRPVPDPAAGWAALEPLLEPRTGAGVPLWRRRVVRRAVVLVAAAVLGVGAVAYAAGPEGLRREVNGAVVRIVQFLEPGGRGPSPSSPVDDRSGRSGPGSDDDRRGQEEDEGPSDRSGPGGGEDEREDERSGRDGEPEEAEEPADDGPDDASGPGSGAEGEDRDDGADDSSGPGSAEPDGSSGPGGSGDD